MNKTERRGNTRIAFYIPTMGGGGAESTTLTLINQFLAKGYEIDLVLNAKKGTLVEKIPSGVRVVELAAASRSRTGLMLARTCSCTPHLLGRLSFLKYKKLHKLRYLPSLVGYLKAEQPTVLISALWLANVVSTLAVRRACTRTAVIACFHSTLSKQTGARKQVWWKEYRRRNLYAFCSGVYRLADARVTVSVGATEDLEKITGLPEDTIQTIHNPVVDENLLQRAACKSPHPWLTDGSVPVILAAGHLEPVKDFTTLIEAFALVRELRSLRLIILGEGDQRQDLSERIFAEELEHVVDLPGWVDNPHAYMAHADVFVLSSRYEGLPTVLIEALACGCPVVATDCPHGPREILSDGHYGRLVPVGDAEALAQAIDEGLDNPGDREQRIRRASDFPLIARLTAIKP